MIRTNLHVTTNAGGTQHALELPGPLRRMRLRRSNNLSSRWSWVDGAVTNSTPDGGSIVIPSGDWFDTGWLEQPARPLYFASEQPGAAFRLQVWTAEILETDFAFSYGFQIAFEA